MLQKRRYLENGKDTTAVGVGLMFHLVGKPGAIYSGDPRVVDVRQRGGIGLCGDRRERAQYRIGR